MTRDMYTINPGLCLSGLNAMRLSSHSPNLQFLAGIAIGSGLCLYATETPPMAGACQTQPRRRSCRGVVALRYSVNGAIRLFERLLLQWTNRAR